MSSGVSIGSTVLRASLSALHYTALDRLLMPLTRGTGAIFMLHHVLPAVPMAFVPNSRMEITPEFLDRTIRLVRERGFDVISLDEARARLGEGDLDRPFVCFTLDDGYRDALAHAYPVFKRHGLPFAVYVATDLADGYGMFWWRALEHLLREVDAIELKIDGVSRHFVCAEPREKLRAYTIIDRWLRTLPEREVREIVADLSHAHGIDAGGQCRALAMDWDEVRTLANDPLVTIGGHTRRHLPLAELSYAEARAEIEASSLRIAHELQRPCRHFSFPEGAGGGAGAREFELAREAGLLTAVTGRGGLLKPQHGTALGGLPRVALSGDFQHPRYVSVLLSGAPFAFEPAARHFSGYGLSVSAPA